ncbi:MAG: SDR family NAD(P)-dependent oxidoreductase [Candidatus Sericytochromatia bacterium]
MKDLKDRVVVITGAASGIGRALALQFYAAGCRLALADINLRALQQLAQSLPPGPKVTIEALNVSDREAMYVYAEQVMQDHGQVDILINNAGVTVVDSAETTSYADFEWLMGINFWGVVYGCRAFLPYLKQSPDGCLVNISSIFGLIGFPTQAAYNASKFAVKGFTESLNQELRLENARLRAVSVHPGGINTNITRSARFGSQARWMGSPQEVQDMFYSKLARTSPDQAAATIIRGISARRTRILIGADAHFVDWMQRLLPSGYQAVNTLCHRWLARSRTKETKDQPD